MIKKDEVIFVLKFVFLFVLFYFGTELWIGITSKGRYYSYFIDEYFNGVKIYRLLILKLSIAFNNLFGYTSYLLNDKTAVGFNGSKVNMVYSCIGYGLLSFWAAFVFSFPINKVKKIKWFLFGLITITLINILRVSLLLFFINYKKDISSFSNHHTIYNVIVYIYILFLILQFLRSIDLKLYSKD